MNLEDVRVRLDLERRYLARDDETVQILPHLTRVMHDSHRTISWSRLEGQDVDGLIAEELEHQRKSDQSFEWKLYGHDRPVDLLSRLQRHGLIPGESEAVLVYDLVNGAPRCLMDDGVVRRVVRTEQLDDYRRVVEEALGKDYSLTCGELAQSLSRGSTQHRGYIAYADGEPVSVGRLYTHPLSVFGGLYGGTTRVAYRRRGFYRALIAARAKDALESGARYLLVDALPTSRPILEQLGFRHLADTVPCEWSKEVAEARPEHG